MVFMNIDFYKLKEEILRELIARIEKIEVASYPLDTAWLLYALSFEDGENNLSFKKVLNHLEIWVLSKLSGTKDKDLAPLSLCCYISNKEEVLEKAIEKIKSIIERNVTKSPLPKFNVLNDPEQIFCVSLLNEKLSEENKSKLIEVIKKNIGGSIVRNIFFSASLYEFGEKFDILEKLKSIENSEEVILSLWLVENYRNKINVEVSNFWNLFEGVYPRIAINEANGENYLSNRDLALLYRAVTIEVKEPDPNMLFDLYPIHPEIKKIAQDHFKNKKYVSAVFEAIKKLNEKLQNVSGIDNKSESELIQATMKQISNPDNLVVRFNEFLSEESGKNEQAGLSAIFEGVFKAFRNPKGHKPEDHPLLETPPYDALDQLIVLDYLWKRLENAIIRRKEYYGTTNQNQIQTN